MKIPHRTVKLTEELDSAYVNAAGDPYYFMVPRGFSEGTIDARAKAERDHHIEVNRLDDKGKPVHDDDARQALAREWTARALDVVSDWNLEAVDPEPGEAPGPYVGKGVLPLPRTLDSIDEKLAVMASLPSEVLALIATSMYRAPRNVDRDRVEGFSRTS